MVKVNLGELKDVKDDLAALLERKLGVKPVVEGGGVVIEDDDKTVKVKDVKLHLKKFLHSKGLRRKFRILVEKGELNIVALEQEEEEEE